MIPIGHLRPTVQKAVASMNVERTVRTWDNWRIVRAAETSEKGYYYNLYVRTDNPSAYVAALDELHAGMRERAIRCIYAGVLGAVRLLG